MSMTSPPTSPKAKRGVRSYIREQYGRLVRSHSRSPSQQSIEVIDSDTGFITPLPTQGSTSTFSNFLAPPSSKQAAILRHARSDSQISPNLNPNSTKHTGSSSRSVIWVGLRTGLQELQKAASLFHPLESAVSGLIACVSLMEVCISFVHQNRIHGLTYKRGSQRTGQNMKRWRRSSKH